VASEAHAPGTICDPFGDSLFSRSFTYVDAHDDVLDWVRVVVSFARPLFEEYRVMYLGSHM
jgi:hypothetical protein